jgi:hypothetical protein
MYLRPKSQRLESAHRAHHDVHHEFVSDNKTAPHAIGEALSKIHRFLLIRVGATPPISSLSESG